MIGGSPAEIARAHHDAFLVDLFGATAVAPWRLAELVSGGYTSGGMLPILGLPPGLDAFAAAVLLASMLGQTPTAGHEERARPLAEWARPLKREVEARTRGAGGASGVGAGLASGASGVGGAGAGGASGVGAGLASGASGVGGAGAGGGAAGGAGAGAVGGGAGGAAGGGTMIAAPPAWMTPNEREAWIQARTRGAEFARGLGNKVADDLSTSTAEVWEGENVVGPVDEEARIVLRETIREKVAEAVAEGWDADQLASELGHATGDWSRNWRRIAETEIQGAFNDATALDVLRWDGPEGRIAKVPEPGACVHCRRLYLDENGRPRIFNVAALIEAGTNVGKPAEQWTATLWPAHPHCRCATTRVPPGAVFDDAWRLVMPED